MNDIPTTATARKAGRMHQLLQLGQSVWLDYLRRDMLRSGQLEALIERGLRGMTSNPSIFEKAIGEHTDYDDALRDMGAGLSDIEVFERLAVADVQGAADQLRQVYDDSDGADGFVSLEVSPGLARDTDGTIEEARRLWKWVDRPNVMIKIPGTERGWPAIEHSLAAGINVNITLLFSVEHHREVAEAYMRALEQRLGRDLPINRIASVASFFVSRVDSIIEKRLQGRESDLRRFAGKVGIANARLAYALFEELTGSDRWRALADSGARVQRPLWASTGTKNPRFSDVLYVDSLIGPDTINTLPPETLAAFEQHGTVAETLTGHARESQDLMDALEDAGVSFADIARVLEDEGIATFAKAYDGLLDVIAKKRRELTAATNAKPD
ncbi:MAG: transaldolase [Gammaproteobacteria bacterium]|nr:transaldolase [Gammaproteobacteria bacterium]